MTAGQHASLRRLASSNRGTGLVVDSFAVVLPPALHGAPLVLTSTADALELRGLVTTRQQGRYRLASLTAAGRRVAAYQPAGGPR